MLSAPAYFAIDGVLKAKCALRAAWIARYATTPSRIPPINMILGGLPVGPVTRKMPFGHRLNVYIAGPHVIGLPM